MPNSFVCSICGKEAQPKGRLAAGAPVKTLKPHNKCGGAVLVLAKVAGQGEKKQARDRAKQSERNRVEKNRHGKNRMKRSGTHEEPGKKVSKGKRMAHTSKTANKARENFLAKQKNK